MTYGFGAQSERERDRLAPMQLSCRLEREYSVALRAFTRRTNFTILMQVNEVLFIHWFD